MILHHSRSHSVSPPPALFSASCFPYVGTSPSSPELPYSDAYEPRITPRDEDLQPPSGNHPLYRTVLLFARFRAVFGLFPPSFFLLCFFFESNPGRHMTSTSPFYYACSGSAPSFPFFLFFCFFFFLWDALIEFKPVLLYSFD